MKLIERFKKENQKKEKKIYFCITNQYDLETDLKRINNSNINNKEYINLSQILLIIRKVLLSLYQDKEILEDNIDNIIQHKFGNNSFIAVYNIKDNMIELGFTINNKNKKFKKIIIIKENNKYIIKKDETNKGEIILNLIQRELNNFFKLNEIFNYFNNQYKNEIRCINSSLKVDISLYSINVYIGHNKNLLKIRYNIVEDKIDVNGINNMIEIIKGKETELLNKLYIKIKDCPKYYQNEINNQQRKKYKIKKYSK